MTSRDLEELFDRMVSDMCYHFDRTFVELEQQISWARKAAMHLDQKVDRKFEAIVDQLNRGFTNMQAILNR